MGIKTVEWTLQTTKEIARDDLYMAKKGILAKETEPLLIAAQNNAIKINYVKSRNDDTKKNCKCRISGDGLNT